VHGLKTADFIERQRSCRLSASYS